MLKFIKISHLLNPYSPNVTFLYPIVCDLRVVYDFNAVNLLSPCVNQFIHLIFSELLPLSLYCFSAFWKLNMEYLIYYILNHTGCNDGDIIHDITLTSVSGMISYVAWRRKLIQIINHLVTSSEFFFSISVQSYNI